LTGDCFGNGIRVGVGGTGCRNGGISFGAWGSGIGSVLALGFGVFESSFRVGGINVGGDGILTCEKLFAIGLGSFLVFSLMRFNV